jgi:hypothetical protein
MSSRRWAFLNVVFATFILGSLYDIVRDQEHWPFSQYPMFSGVWRAPSFTWLRLYGVTPDGREMALDANHYIWPFDQSRLPKALRNIRSDPRREPRLNQALEGLMARYHELAREGTHNGPPLTELRLYEVEWTIDPAAANIDRPDRRLLVATVPSR